MISVIEINHCNRPRENNSIKMPLESKRRSASQRLMIVFIVGWIVFGFILSRYTKITFSAGYENLEMKDQYYMPSYWGSHECSRSSSPCKDIPDYLKGLIYQLCHDGIRYTRSALESFLKNQRQRIVHGMFL